MRYSALLRFRLSTMFVVMAVVAMLITVNFRPHEVPWDSSWDMKSAYVDDEPPKFAVAYGWPWLVKAVYEGEPAKNNHINWARFRRKSNPRAVYNNLVVGVVIVLLSAVITEMIPSWFQKGSQRQKPAE